MKEHSQDTEWEGEKTEGGWRFGKGEREKEKAGFGEEEVRKGKVLGRTD